MINLFKAMYTKELLDASRDKRSIMAGLYYAVGAPVLFCVLFMAIITKMVTPDTLSISIINAAAAPDLVRYLENNGIEAAEENDKSEITLVIDGDYAHQMNSGKPAQVFLQADYSKDSLRDSLRKVERKLNEYSGNIASLRLISRGVDPTLLRPVEFQVQDSATPDSKGSMIYGIATLSIILSVFFGAMNLAIDTTAGERERNSLALLLSHPISVTQLILSKVAAIATLSTCALLLVLLVSKFAYPMVPWEEMGFSVSLSYEFVVFSLIIGFPIALLAAGLLVYVSFMAKSFKEAQSYLTFVLFIPIGLSMLTTYNIAVEKVKWLPVAGQQSAMIEFIKGNAIMWPELLVSSFATMILAIGLIIMAGRMLKSEKVVFGL
ncbi:ABC-type Na+ efflux pump, permease component [Pseudoalteromonas luteoviolacea B = ATCC 29581]|nr:ABC-type Na+ efflux pump, permease component [Pseudoalteromonas luteoviolacea B = ATCC 29581]